MNRTTFFCLSLTAALILTACSSGGGGSGGGGVAADIGAGLADALTAPLDHKDKGLKSLTLEDSIPQNGTLTLSAQGAEKTFKAGGKDNSLNTGKLKNDKISRFDFVQKIEVDGQTITLASGEFQIYKQDHSAVVALQIEKINNPDKIDSLINQRSFLVSGLGGEHTAFNQLPGGKAEYHGKAFSSDDPNGRLHYTIDFTNKQGYGRIGHLKTPELNVDLASAELKADEKSHAVILGDTRYGSEEKGTYHLPRPRNRRLGNREDRGKGSRNRHRRQTVAFEKCRPNTIIYRSDGIFAPYRPRTRRHGRQAGFTI